MEPCEFTHALQARRLKALADDLRQYPQERLTAFETMIENTEQDWLTVDEVAAKLRVHRETVKRWIRGGKLKAVKAGKLHRIAPDDVQTFLSGTSENQHDTRNAQ